MVVPPWEPPNRGRERRHAVQQEGGATRALHARTGLKIIMLGGANQTQRVYTIPFIENSRKCRLICRDREWNSGGLRVGPGAGLDRGDPPGYGCLHWRGDGDDSVRVNVSTYQLYTLTICSFLCGIYTSVTMLKKETARPELLGHLGTFLNGAPRQERLTKIPKFGGKEW